MIVNQKEFNAIQYVIDAALKNAELGGNRMLDVVNFIKLNINITEESIENKEESIQNKEEKTSSK